ncbi:MAG: phosphoribosylaminoimidazolesuccinocarboxamide synthase [bacterium]|nr:phosphoribosylaminoimidazolesuccinocarboxamide synthase [bacterium]
MLEIVLLNTNIKDVRTHSKGKVRDIYDLGDKLLIIATDRISAFDVILPNGIPHKGKVLTALSLYWFEQTRDIIKNHLITADVAAYPIELAKYKDVLAERSMLVKKTKVLPVECVVRGYLAGSGWKEYQMNQSVCGIKLPAGLVESAKLQEPIFTPSTKATSGHDINITHSQIEDIVGVETAKYLKEVSIRIFEFASNELESKGIILADTKFEFGVFEDEIILIDEVLTPDSSRFWPGDEYCPGKSQPSFDKQFVRDYLEKIKWDKNPPAPTLPDIIVKKTSEKYLEAYRRIIN